MKQRSTDSIHMDETQYDDGGSDSFSFVKVLIFLRVPRREIVALASLLCSFTWRTINQFFLLAWMSEAMPPKSIVNLVNRPKLKTTVGGEAFFWEGKLLTFNNKALKVIMIPSHPSYFKFRSVMKLRAAKFRRSCQQLKRHANCQP